MTSPFYDPFKGAGKVINIGPNKVVWYTELSDGNIATCVQELVSPILEDNQQARADSAGTRWGDGATVASIPLGLYFEKLAPAKLAGDDAYVKRVLNDRDYYKLRTRDGTI